MNQSTPRQSPLRTKAQWRNQVPGPELGHAEIVVADIGGTSIKCGALRAGDVLSGTMRSPTSDINTSTPVEALARLLTCYIESHALSPSVLISTVPGFIDTDFDHVLKTCNVPALDGHPLASELSSLLQLPVVLERDVVLLLEGEHRAGAAQGCDEVAGVFIGTGIGGAAISGGQPFRGAGWAMEIGHIHLPEPVSSSDTVTLGPTLENRASGVALATLANTWGIPIDLLFVEAANDDVRQATLNAIVADHAFAVLATIACVSPKMLILGGGVLEMQAYPHDRLLQLINTHLPYGDSAIKLDIRVAELGWQAALHGALALVERLSLPPGRE